MTQAEQVNNKAKILVIDDDRDVCEVLVKNLTNDGYDTACVFTSQEGISRLKDSKYDIVILDLKLPDASGTETIKKIRELDKEVIVLILTGYPSLETAIETFKNYAADYLTKPYNVTQLRTLIHNQLEKKWNELEQRLTELHDIGKKIKELRKLRNFSLDILANKTDLSKSFLSEMERGKRFPRLDTLHKIANALGVTVHFFFSS